MARRWALSVLVAVALALLCRPAGALINPKFTPIDLVKGAKLILLVKFEGAPKDGRITGQVVEVLQGEFNQKELTIKLAGATKPEQIKPVEQLVADGRAKTALFFTDDRDVNVEKGYLHMDVSWLVVVREDEGWGFDQLSQEMQGTWNGGSDMLERCVRYILKDEDAEVPVKTGTRWADAKVLGKVEGPASVVRAVVLAEPGVPALFVGSKGGDKLWVMDKKEATGVRAIELPSKSGAATWGDFDGDGRIDLLSCDGKGLSLITRGEDGKFTTRRWEGPECLSLSTAEMEEGKTGVIIATSKGVSLVTDIGGKEPRAANLIPPEGTPRGPCLVADFDGDGQVDIIQMGQAGSLFYAGTKPGWVAGAVGCPVALEGGQACTGDWDADGLLDILVGTKAGPKVWHNLGKGQFVEAVKRSGEVGYAAKEGSSWACCGDLNNDGRQDQVVLYGASGPQLFFNRGFRSFGLSLSMDLGKGELLAGLAKGAQAGCVSPATRLWRSQ